MQVVAVAPVPHCHKMKAVRIQLAQIQVFKFVSFLETYFFEKAISIQALFSPEDGNKITFLQSSADGIINPRALAVAESLISGRQKGLLPDKIAVLKVAFRKISNGMLDRGLNSAFLHSWWNHKLQLPTTCKL
jgi:hypothetical protein